VWPDPWEEKSPNFLSKVTKNFTNWKFRIFLFLKFAKYFTKKFCALKMVLFVFNNTSYLIIDRRVKFQHRNSRFEVGNTFSKLSQSKLAEQDGFEEFRFDSRSSRVSDDVHLAEHPFDFCVWNWQAKNLQDPWKNVLWKQFIKTELETRTENQYQKDTVPFLHYFKNLSCLYPLIRYY